MRDVAPVAIALREKGIRSCSYHGKNMSSHDKVKAMDHWRPNDSSIQVMVCTSAFGMGIDVANIDLVIKISCPSSVEELVQMFGRAGRDGRRAEGIYTAACVLMYMYFRCIASDVHDSCIYIQTCTGILLYSESDLQHAAFWCKGLTREGEQGILRQFQAVWQYVYSHVLGKRRRKAMLEYFGEELHAPEMTTGECCDVCSNPASMQDYQAEMTAILTGIREIPERGEKKVRGMICLITMWHYIGMSSG